jgi:threonine/homoserine/homoserine lactone efflux protein
LFNTGARLCEILRASILCNRNDIMAFITPEFLLTSLIVVIAPGTGTLYTIATGLAAGRGMSFAAAFGCTLGIIPHMLAAITGLAAILHSTPAPSSW